MKLNKIISLVSLLLVSFPTVMMAQSQSWTDNTGKFSVTAEFLRLDGEVVWLRKDDGTKISVPLLRLSEASLKLARQLNSKSAKQTGWEKFIQGEQGPLHIQQARRSIFAPDSNGQCPSEQDVILFCDDRLCVVWQKSALFEPPNDNARVLKSLKILQSYIEFASQVMDYQPLPSPQPNVVGTDGKTRTYIIELVDELCPGFGGAGYNGHSWIAVPKERFMQLYQSAHKKKPTVHQVFFYELGRNTYDVKLDNILDWQLEDETKYGFWTLGFNGAMTILAPEALALEMDYFGMNSQECREKCLKHIQEYIDNPKYNFDNAWCVYLLPWANEYPNRESVNGLMSGLLIILSDQMGGIEFLSHLFRHLKEQPTAIDKSDQRGRAKNLYRAARAAAASMDSPPEKIDKLFKETLRWDFLD